MNPIRSIEYQILLLNQNKAIDKISTISIQIDFKCYHSNKFWFSIRKDITTTKNKFQVEKADESVFTKSNRNKTKHKNKCRLFYWFDLNAILSLPLYSH